MSAKRLDPQSPCPGDAGKSIRECGCRSLLNDLNNVSRAIEGEQYRAALDQLDRLLSKHGPKPCLSMLHYEVLSRLGDYEAASQTLERLLEAHPGNAPALASLAILRLVEDDPKWADCLIESFEHAENSEQTRRCYADAIVACRMLIQRRRCLTFFVWVDVILQVMQDSKVSTFLRDIMPADALTTNSLALAIDLLGRPISDAVMKEAEEAEDSAEQLSRAQHILSLVHRGKFNSARPLIREALEHHPDDPRFRRLALRDTAARGDIEAIARALREWPKREISNRLERIWLESVAQAAEAELDRNGELVCTIEFHVQDAQETVRRLEASPRIRDTDMKLGAMLERSMKQKAAFQLFDRDLPFGEVTSIEQALESPCRVVGVVAVGTATSPERRASVVVRVPEAHRDSTLDLLRDVLGDQVVGEADIGPPQRIMDLTTVYGWLNWDVSSVTGGLQAEVAKRLAEGCGMELWLQRPHFALGGKTPLEAAEEPELAEKLEAAVWNVEVCLAASGFDIDFNALRRRLKIPEIETVDPWQRDVGKLTVIEWMYLDPLKTGKDECVTILSEAEHLGHRGAMMRMVEILSEVAADEPMLLANACLRIGMRSPYHSEKAEWYGKAAEWLDRDPDASSLELRLQQAKEYLMAGDGEAFQSHIFALLNADLSQEENEKLMAFVNEIGLFDRLIERMAEISREADVVVEPVAAEEAPSKLWLPGDP